MLYLGFYEQIINRHLRNDSEEIPEACKAAAPINKVERSKALVQYLCDIEQKGLDNVVDNSGDLAAQVDLTNQIESPIEKMTEEADFAARGVDARAEQLLTLLREANPWLAAGKSAKGLPQQETSLTAQGYMYHQERRK